MQQWQWQSTQREAKSFCEYMMNQRAQALGMKDTSFKNCTGLPEDNHYTSAYDISLMSRELLKHPTILKYTGTYMETISEAEGPHRAS